MDRPSWTIAKMGTVGSLLAVLILSALSLAAYRATQALLDTRALASHTTRVVRALKDHVVTLQDCENAQRGFIITGNERFLVPFRKAALNLKTNSTELHELAHTPAQHQRLAQVDALVQQRIDQLTTRIELRRTQGFEAAARAVDDSATSQTMANIRGILDDMTASEESVLEVRHQDEANTARVLVRTLLMSVVIGAALMALIAIVLSRSLNRRIRGIIQRAEISAAVLKETAAQQATSALEQVAASKEVATTTQELLSTSRQIAENARSVARIAADTTSAARVGEHTLEQAQRAIEAIRHQVDHIVTHMLTLGKRSQEIGGILEIINDLAEQTNILAINATIEAAGASEAGRRFGVVAEEIRRLADRVAGSTKEIRGLIEDVRSASNTTVMATEDGAKAVSLGARQIADVTVSFKHIVDLVANTAQASREIELSTQQQTTAVEQVNLALGEVTRAAAEAQQSSGRALQTATEMSGMSTDLTQLIGSQKAAA